VYDINRILMEDLSGERSDPDFSNNKRFSMFLVTCQRKPTRFSYSQYWILDIEIWHGLDIGY
jgi:hypothetical protein